MYVQPRICHICFCPAFFLWGKKNKTCLCNKRFDQQVVAAPQDSIKSNEEEERGQHAFKHSG